MMRRHARAWLLLVLPAIGAYALLFALLALDTMIRTVQWAPIIEAGTLSLVLFIEAGKIITGVTAVAAAVWLAVKGRRPGAGALALGLLFASITFAKLMGAGAFPGPFQQWLARGLVDAGAPQRLLSWLFGVNTWPAWPAAAALLRFSAVFPTWLTASRLETSGRADRRGLLRGSRLAGADVGALSRALTRRLLEVRAFSVPALTAFAIAMVAAHITLAATAAAPALWLIAALMAGLLITNVRAGYITSTGHERAAAAWIIVGLVVALYIFLIAATLAVLFAAPATHVAALAMVSVLPAVVVCGFALSVLGRAEWNAPRLIQTVIRLGSVGLALVLLAGATFASARAAGLKETAAFVFSAAVALIASVPVIRVTDRIRDALLERPRGRANRTASHHVSK